MKELKKLAKSAVRYYANAIASAKAKNAIGSSSNFKDSNKVFFVTGFDKSGTTWMRNMINDSEQAVCRGSGQFFNFYSPNVNFIGEPSLISQLSNGIINNKIYKSNAHIWLPIDMVNTMISNQLTSLFLSYQTNDTQLVGDKSVVQDLSQIVSYFPSSKVIVLVRDGRDITVSFAHQFTRKGQSSRFDSNGNILNSHVEKVALAYKKYYNHFESHFDNKNVIFVKYETLLDDTASEMKKVYDELGLSNDRITEIVANNSFKTKSLGRAAGVEDNNSFLRKGVQGDYINYFNDEQLSLFDNIAGDELRTWGYI